MTSPIIFHLGAFEIRLYGILFAIALAQGIYLFQKYAKEAGLTEQFIDRYLLWLSISIVVGARLGEIFFYNPVFYFTHPSEIIAVWHGGLASHGALFAAILTTWIFARKIQYAEVPLPREVELHKIKPFLFLADLGAIPAALGAAIIRIANFFNAEIVGRATTVPWGVTFATYTGPRHPVQLYEAFSLIIIFFILLLIRKKYALGTRVVSPKNKTASAPAGTLFSFFIIFWLTSRFFLEFLKDMPTYAGLTTAQWLNIPLVLGAVFFLIYKKKSAPTGRIS